MKSVNPYLSFPGNTAAAFDFYKSVFGTDYVVRMRFRDFGDNGMGVAEEDLDKIVHVSLPIGNGTLLMGTDSVGGRSVSFGNNFSINLEPESGAEAATLFGRLSDGGEVIMPLARTEWAEKYGACTDRFGVQWMVNYPGDVRFPGSAQG